jgi:hypothetical protein
MRSYRVRDCFPSSIAGSRTDEVRGEGLISSQLLGTTLSPGGFTSPYTVMFSFWASASNGVG